MATRKKENIIDLLVAQNQFRQKADIKSWRAALTAAEDVEYPDRKPMYRVFKELILNGEVHSQMGMRIAAVCGSDFSLYKKSGEKDEEATKLFHKTWFYNVMSLAMESKFYGHSLVQIGDLNTKGEVSKVKLVKRDNVVQEKAVFLPDCYDDHLSKNAIKYQEEDNVSDWLFEFGDSEDLGLLNVCAPYAIFEKFARSNFSDFCELWVNPIRKFKTDMKSGTSISQAEEAIKLPGLNPYYILDKDEDLTFDNATNSQGEAFDKFIKLNKNAISQIIWGNVMGQESEGGSRAKEEVSSDTRQQKTVSDKKWFANYMNEVGLVKLAKLGYPVGNLEFKFDKTKNLQQLWKVTEGLIQYTELSEEFCEFVKDNFGVPISPKKVEEKPNEEIKKLSEQLQAITEKMEGSFFD